MLSSRNVAGLVSLAVLLATLTACTKGSNGKNLEQMLAADSRLKDNPVTFGGSGDPQRQLQANGQNAPSPLATPGGMAQLPQDFPNEIPRYPNAQLLEVIQPTSQNTLENNNSTQVNQPQRTIWQTSDPSNLVQSFYQKEFQANNWEILSQTPAEAETNAIAARLNDLQVTVSIAPSSGSSNEPNAPPAPDRPNGGVASAAGNTEFILQYERIAPQANAPQALPQTSNQSSPTPDTNQQNPSTEKGFTDLNKAPQELRQYITDLAALGVLPLQQTGNKSNQSDILTQFDPSKTISHREFARWLVAANNQFHPNRPSLQIREAAANSQPAFQDVPPTDPDFPAIQGLAEAGLIPSRLSGDATAVLFRPDAPLTREQLILWKVPLDSRQGLPNASVDAVRESWGFQDVARIDPKALRAVLADFQNGEQSNIRRVFGYTTLFQPKKPVNRAEAAAALWYFGNASEGISAPEALQLKQQQNQPQSQPSATPEPAS